MVKRAIVKTLFSEAPVGIRNDPKNIYASEDYSELWKLIPLGRPTEQPSNSATKYDFQRWFIRNYLESNSSPLHLEPEERDTFIAQFESMTPDQMANWINLNGNELFALSTYEGDDMALFKILRNYTTGKSLRTNLSTAGEMKAFQKELDRTEKYIAQQKAAKIPSGRMTQDDSEITLDTVRGLVAGDASENLGSRQAIDYRIKSAMGKMENSPEVKQIIRFLLNKNRDESQGEFVMSSIDELMDKVLEATAGYTDLFVDSMFEAFSKVALPEEGESDSEAAFNQQSAFNAAIADLAPNASAHDIAIFKKALNADMGNGMNVHELILNSSASDPGVRSALIKAVMEVFETNTLELEASFYAEGADGDARFEQFVAEFVDAMFDAFTEEGPEMQQAFAEGVADFAAKLQASGVKKPIGSQEIGVFESILLSDVDGQRRIVDIFLNSDAEDAAAYDEVWQASFEKFKSELDKQTLFNSLGDYIDSQPEIIALRREVLRAAKPTA